MTAPFKTPPTQQPGFPKGSIGAFLVDGAEGWPSDYVAHIDDARVSVTHSRVNIERQNCSCRVDAPRDVQYVRVALDVLVERGGDEHVLHVEELFPGRIVEVLAQPLDAHAAPRVRRTILDRLVELDAEEPVDNLLNNCIAPMRLYEPLLNALVPPPTQGSLAEWLGVNIPVMLCGEDGAVIEFEQSGCRVRLKAHELAIKHGLRSPNEVKLIGDVELSCLETGSRRGQWKSRATLMPPTLTWNSLPAPDGDRRAAIEDIARAWRDQIMANLSRRIEEGRLPIMLSDVVPELDLEQAIADASDEAPEAR